MKRILLGRCAVDSGQILLVDPCYLSNWKDGEHDDNKNHYGQCCEMSQNIIGGGEILVSGIAGMGVVASSGLGDGNYPVYAEYANVGSKSSPDIRIKSLTIDFQLDKMAGIYKRLTNATKSKKKKA